MKYNFKKTIMKKTKPNNLHLLINSVLLYHFFEPLSNKTGQAKLLFLSLKYPGFFKENALLFIFLCYESKALCEVKNRI